MLAGTSSCGLAITYNQTGDGDYASEYYEEVEIGSWIEFDMRWYKEVGGLMA